MSKEEVEKQKDVPDPLNQHEREVKEYPGLPTAEFRELPPDLKLRLAQNYAVRNETEVRTLSGVECAEQLLWEAQETEKAEEARKKEKEEQDKEAEKAAKAEEVKEEKVAKRNE